MPENIFLESQDEQLEKVLDAVDLRTNAQTQLHSALMDGFISLARERYRDSLATYRLEHVCSEERQMKSNVHVSIENQSQQQHQFISFSTYHPEQDKNKDSSSQQDNEMNTSISSPVMSEGIRQRKQPKTTDDNHHKDHENHNTTNDSENNGEIMSDESKNDHIKDAPVIALPSTELREAIKSFTTAVEYALKVASENSRVDSIIQSSSMDKLDS